MGSTLYLRGCSNKIVDIIGDFPVNIDRIDRTIVLAKKRKWALGADEDSIGVFYYCFDANGIITCASDHLGAGKKRQRNTAGKNSNKDCKAVFRTDRLLSINIDYHGSCNS